jgi:lysophospholipase L1-like esterase
MACVLLVFAAVSFAQQSLQSGDRVAICGDSITEQKIYSLYMEDYLLMCQPQAKVQAIQFGWSGETTWGFAGRIDSDVLPFKPTVATTFYGMNDGGYTMLADDRAKQFQDATTQIVESFKKAGVRYIVVGSPGAVDTDTFHFLSTPAVYNKTLEQLGEMAQAIAKKENVAFVDVHSEMLNVMAAAKAKYGKSYVFAGPDGIHPGPNGHLVIAYCFLKALGCDGDIGTITFDAASHKADASPGHKIISVHGNDIQIESSKYPFCFYGDPATSNATSGIIQFFPFNTDLNRFMLIVKNTPSPQTKITFGKTSKVFTAEQLAQGINLAAEFLDNPFCSAFSNAEQAIEAQQAFETPAVKQLLHNAPQYRDLLPAEQETFNRLVAATLKRDQDLRDAAAAAVTPVDYAITVEPVAAAH